MPTEIRETSVIDDVHIEVYKLLGVPWNLHANTPQEGFDCLTFVVHVLGLIADITGDRRRWACPEPMAALYGDGDIAAAEWDRLHEHFDELLEPEFGAIVELRGGLGLHVGIVIDHGTLVAHCERGRGVVVQPVSRIRHRVSTYLRLRPETTVKQTDRDVAC